MQPTHRFPTQFSSQSLAAGQWRELLPEFYALETVTENGSHWHVQQRVFDHAVAVIRGLETSCAFAFLAEKQRVAADAYFAQTQDQHTYLDLLWVAGLLHDIGKSKTLVVDGDRASSPGHEIVSTAMVPLFQSRLELSAAELERVIRIVRFHGFVNDIVTQIQFHAAAQATEFWQLFESIVGDIALELAFHLRADILGSNLPETDPEDSNAKLHLLDTYITETLNHHSPPPHSV